MKLKPSSEYECYHAVCQYSDDACDGCKYEMDCYNRFLEATISEQAKKSSAAMRKVMDFITGDYNEID